MTGSRSIMLAGLLLLWSLVSGISVGVAGATLATNPPVGTVPETNLAPTALACGGITYQGNGTATAPYQIETVQQLQCIGQQNSSAHYVLVANIDASATANWNDGKGFRPIQSFSGIVDGAGHNITGVTIHRPSENNVGLFGTLETGALIKDVELDDVDVDGGSLRTGGLVAQNNGTVRAATVSGHVSGTENVGGLVGVNYARVLHSAATGTVTGNSDVGGLIGLNDGTVATSHTSNTVRGTWIVGGLIGNNQAMVKKSYAAGSVEGVDSAGVDGDIGGLVGYNSGTLIRTYATSTVTGTTAVGGLVGRNGLIAQEGVVNLSYAAGPVTGNSDVGGLVGLNGAGTVENSYWDWEATGQDTSSGSGTSLTTAEMTGASAPANMDAFGFPENWASVTGDYPALSWQSVTENLKPTVTLGQNRSVTGGSTVQLTSSATDPDADSLTYSWTIIEGNGTLSGTGQSVVYHAPTVIHQETTVTIELAVSDGEKSATDTISLHLEYRNETQIDIDLNTSDPLSDSFSIVAAEELSLELNKTQLQYPVTNVDWEMSGPVTIEHGAGTEAVTLGFTDAGTPTITAVVEFVTSSGETVTRQSTISGTVYEFDPENHPHVTIEFGEGVSLSDSRYRAAFILHHSESVYQRIQQRMFNLPDQFTIRMVNPEYRDGCLACAIGDDTVIIGSNVDSIQRALLHEFTHIAQAHNNMDYQGAYWNTLLEGHAEVEATQPGISSTYFAASKPSKDDLQTWAPDQLEEYRDGELLVEAMLLKYGRQATLAIFEDSAGGQFTTRFKAVTGESFASFYENWHPEDVNRGYSNISIQQFPTFTYADHSLVAISATGVCTNNPCTSLSALNPEWDVDNDGVFERTGTTINWTPSEDGVHAITLRYTKKNTSLSMTQKIYAEATDTIGGGATDPDNDGIYEDVDGDGEFTIADVNLLFHAYFSGEITGDNHAFDASGDGEFNIADVNALFAEYFAT